MFNWAYGCGGCSLWWPSEVRAAENSHLTPQAGQRAQWECCKSTETSEPPPPSVTHLLQQDHASSSFPNNFTNWGLKYWNTWAHRGHCHSDHHRGEAMLTGALGWPVTTYQPPESKGRTERGVAIKPKGPPPPWCTSFSKILPTEGFITSQRVPAAGDQVFSHEPLEGISYSNYSIGHILGFYLW